MGTALAIHIVGIILWVGGLFVLTRHVGGHAGLDDAPHADMESFESKTYFMSTLPGLVLTVGSGLYLLFVAHQPSYYLSADGAWGSTFHVKLLLVVVLFIVDQVFLQRMRRFHRDGNAKRSLFMAFHGTIGLCFIVIVFLMEGGYLR